MELPVIYPMAAKAVDDPSPLWNDPNYVAQEKFDGARYLLYIIPGGKNRLFSRHKSVVTGMPVEKTDNVPHLRDMKFGFISELTILDGEILLPGGPCTSSEVASVMGADPELAVSRQVEKGKVVYKVFDILYLNGQDVMDIPFIERDSLLAELLSDGIPQGAEKYIQHVPFVTKNKEEYYESIVRAGGEGVILKHKDALYFPDKRPANNWVKVKKYATFDVVVMGFDPPEREYKGKNLDSWPYWTAGGPVTKFYWNKWIGAIRFGQYRNGVLTEVGTTSGIDEALRAEISANPDKYLGKVFECGAMERIKKTGALRHPRFLHWREDKNPTDCVWGEC